ncbi:helix-turn-helix transcriptional regulator [Bdellovibrionota bacterium FG-2]
MAWFNLGKALDKKGWSMRRLAEELDVRPPVITRYFRQGFDPNASTLLRWCSVLECSLNELLDESLDENEKLMPEPKSAREWKKKIQNNKINKKRRSK